MGRRIGIILISANLHNEEEWKIRAEFSEEAMYRRMDQKDRIVAFFGVVLFAAGYDR